MTEPHEPAQKRDEPASTASPSTRATERVNVAPAPAYRIASRAGLLSNPHGGELRGPDSVQACLDILGAERLGHGVRTVEDPALLDRVVARGVTLEVCPASNVALGVYAKIDQVPLRTLVDAGARVAGGGAMKTAIPASLVKELRDLTGAGMMECKAALTEANGNIEEATTILRKRDTFRAAFRGFDPRVVAGFDDADRGRLMADAGIVRNRAKIDATIGNAGAVLETAAAFGSFDAYLASMVPPPPRRRGWPPTGSTSRSPRGET